jgi:RNA polymerase sigma-70 factor (ECF subfamily)
VTQMDVATEFEQYRGYLTGVAYRMLGSLADAEDAVQDAWLRLARVDRADIDDLRAWLTTVTGRLCLDRLRSARVAREAYVGPWLPEPLIERLPDATAPDPADIAVLDESVRMALLVVLEKLTPEQRIAFVLHDVFGAPFDAVANALGVSTEAARQHASRARRAVHEREPRRAAPLAEQKAVMEAFIAACQRGELDGLLALLDPDVVLTSDGGGVVKAAMRPIEGADKVGRWLLAVLADTAGLSFEPVLVNGDVGAVGLVRQPGTDRAEPAGVVSLEVTPGGRITRLALVVNPAKLTHLKAT